ncbi:MAG: hypothetical protein Q9183_004007 [Haloplaca sp. 2 TL-2023]
MPPPCIYQCDHPACPIDFPHAKGLYLHNGHTAPTWTYGNLNFGASNPPLQIWDARERLLREVGSYEDYQMVTGFILCHHIEREVSLFETFKMGIEAQSDKVTEQANAMKMEIDGLGDAMQGVTIESTANANEGTVDEMLAAALEDTTGESSPLSEISDDGLARLLEEIMENDNALADDDDEEVQAIQEAADKMNLDDDKDEQDCQVNTKQLEHDENLPGSQEGIPEGPTLALDEGTAELIEQAYNGCFANAEDNFFDDIL